MVYKGFLQEYERLIIRNKKNINYIFLGVGLTIFIMNVTAFLTFVDSMDYSKFFFNTSLLSSMIIILVSVYNIHNGH